MEFSDTHARARAHTRTHIRALFGESYVFGVWRVAHSFSCTHTHTCMRAFRALVFLHVVAADLLDFNLIALTVFVYRPRMCDLYQKRGEK